MTDVAQPTEAGRVLVTARLTISEPTLALVLSLKPPHQSTEDFFRDALLMGIANFIRINATATAN